MTVEPQVYADPQGLQIWDCIPGGALIKVTVTQPSFTNNSAQLARRRYDSQSASPLFQFVP